MGTGRNHEWGSKRSLAATTHLFERETYLPMACIPALEGCVVAPYFGVGWHEDVALFFILQQRCRADCRPWMLPLELQPHFLCHAPNRSEALATSDGGRGHRSFTAGVVAPLKTGLFWTTNSPVVNAQPLLDSVTRLQHPPVLALPIGGTIQHAPATAKQPAVFGDEAVCNGGAYHFLRLRGVAVAEAFIE